MEQRTCPACGASFTPTHWNQRYCPPTDEDRASLVKVISRCARAGENARYLASATVTVDCKRCGKPFTRSRKVTRVYCSDECHHAEKHERHAHSENLWRTDPNVLPLAAPDPLRGEDVEGYVGSMLRDPCAYCGEPSDSVDHIVPRQADGADDWTNFTGACRRCNTRKTFNPLLLFLGWDQAKREFEPWRAAVSSLHREHRERLLAA